MSTPLWKALLIERRLPYRYKHSKLYLYSKCLFPYLYHSVRQMFVKADVVIDVEGLNYRYLHMIVRFFRGHDVLVLRRRGFKNYVNSGKYGWLLFAEKGVKFSSQVKGKGIYLYDKGKYKDRDWRKKIKVNSDIMEGLREGKLVLPFSINPFMFKLGREKYRAVRKKNTVVFLGNADPDSYTNQKMKDMHGRMNRAEAVRIAEENGVYVVKTSDWVLKPVQWMQKIAESKFLLCPPGVYMPMCHNVIEAMAVGTIPITNYPDWFRPKLEGGKNCILFDDEESLKKVLHEIANMDDEEISTMRINVLKYYEEYLNPDKFIKKLLKVDEVYVYNSGVFER